ncbi:MAG: phosphoenolpyruvate synthase, partial [Candidatus Andersenbacteria bacterium]|nr:phosphoenolpyruvate synthase [Candidatus Andersenbacteria bacterium]
REEFGLTNVIVMVPFCRTVEEGKKVLEVMREAGLPRGKNGLRVYVMAEIPANILLVDEFAKIFDGFSIGSNDLTQLTLGIDRDNGNLSHIANEKNEAVKILIRQLIKGAHKRKRKVGICGQAPSDFPDFAQFVVKEGIDSISLTPDTVLKTMIYLGKKK